MYRETASQQLSLNACKMYLRTCNPQCTLPTEFLDKNLRTEYLLVIIHFLSIQTTRLRQNKCIRAGNTEFNTKTRNIDSSAVELRKFYKDKAS